MKRYLQSPIFIPEKIVQKMYFQEYEGLLMWYGITWNSKRLHKCDEVVCSTMRHSIPVSKKCNLQVPESQRKHWSRYNASSDYIESMRLGYQSRQHDGQSILLLFPFHSYSSQLELIEVWHYHALNKGTVNGYNVRYDMSSENLICITLWSVNPNNMQACAPT